MIQFFINNIELVLPEDISFVDIEENTLLTENGEYSLDIEISLLEPNNIKALDFYNRKNKLSDKDSFDATKRANGKNTEGKFIILKCTDISASCQFVSGTSEVIYTFGENRKIWELDFGEEEAISKQNAIDSVMNPSWQNGYCCIPVKFSNCISNNYKLPLISLDNSVNPAQWRLHDANGIIIGVVNLGDPITINNVENITMHTYLLYYIDKLPELLGFKMANNVLLNNSKIMKKILINRSDSLKYSDALPDITIKEFISAIEYQYNVVFDFDSSTKTLSIVNTKSYVDEMPLVSPEVIDNFTKEPNSKPYRFDFSRLAYELNSSDFGKFQKLEQQIVDKCAYSEFPSALTLSLYLHEDMKNKFNLFGITSSKRQYIFSDGPEIGVYRRIVSGTSGFIINVNKFRDYQNIGDKEIILPIIPIDFTQELIGYQITGQGGTIEMNFSYQLPIVPTELYVDQNQSILDAIESSVKSITRADKLEVCFYNGMIDLPRTNEVKNAYFKPNYPISFVDDYPEFWLPNEDINENIAQNAGYFQTWLVDHYFNVATETMRIVGTNGIFECFYNSENVLDTSHIYTFYFPKDENNNAKSILIHDGNKYMPLKIERIRGLDSTKEIKGSFYRLK